MLVYILFIILLALLLFLLSMIWPPDSPWSPWWRTSNKTARVMCLLAKVSKEDVVFDLGSGEGTALITAAREFGAKGVGVEIDPFRYLISKIAIILNGVSHKIKIIRKNFFDVDTSSATVVFMYLVPKALNKLKPKLLKELRPGTRIVTFVYKMDLPLLESDPENEVYVFVIPQAAKNR